MNQKDKQIYTVVEVVRGITDTVHNFKSLKKAQQFLENAKKKHNLDENDVQLFQSVVIGCD